MSDGEADHAPGLRMRAANSAMFLAISQAVKVAMTILSTIVIARLLSPNDYGVMAMAGPVVAFIVMFQDLGLSSATIQKPTITPTESTALFWINMTASGVVMAILVAVAPLAGLFYGDGRVAAVIAATAATALVAGSGLQHGALLNRDLRFAALSMIDIANAVTTFLVAAIAALLLRNYWALFLGVFAGTTAQAVLLWRVSSWRPSGWPVFGAARQAMHFGSHVTGFNLVNFVVRNADFVLIARFQGAGAVGLYDRSYKLMMFPLQNLNQPLTRLLLPLLSRMQDDPARYRRTFGFAIYALMIASAPGVAVATILSGRLMSFLLGPGWGAAGPIFFWLGLTGLIQPIANMTGVLFMTSGRTRTMLHWGLFSALVTLIGFGVGLRWGAVGIAASLLVTAAARLPILYAISVKGTGVRAGDLYRAQFQPLLGAGIGAAAARMLEPYLDTGPLLVLAMTLSYAATLLTSLMFADGRRVLRGLFDMVPGATKRFRQPRQTTERGGG